MRNTTKMKIALGLLLAAALIFTLTSGPCWAGKTIAADSDKSDTDGFTPEANGLTVYINNTSQTPLSLYPCVSNSTSPERDNCVDPATKDLFVIVWPALSGSLFQTNDQDDPLKYLKLSPLAVGIHRVDRDTTVTSRYLSGYNFGQMAARVQENDAMTCALNGNLFGSSTWGTPNGADNSVVYTACIKEWMTNNFVNTMYLNDVSVTDTSNLIDTFVKQTIAHEVGHTISLTTTANPLYSGNHYAPGTGSIMDQIPLVRTNANGSVSWYISTNWISSDTSGVKLK